MARSPTTDLQELRTSGLDCLTAHFQRNEDDLRGGLSEALAGIAPEANVAVLFLDSSEQGYCVEIASGEGCPLRPGQRVSTDAWTSDELHSFPLDYGRHRLGELLIEGSFEDARLQQVRWLVSHFAVALVNLKLNDEALKTSDHYYAGLQALEEGVVLFQERDKEAVSARFLSLLTSLLSTTPGAIYLLEEPGKPSSELHLESVLGVPETLLDELALPDGTWWPRTALEQPSQVLQRDDEGEMPGLDNARVPPALTSVVACPLRYHGLTVGVALAFNARPEDTNDTKLESVRRLGELGAAIFHRIRLEEVALRSQEVETQLAIASHIQARLLPKEAPAATSVQCAWSSRPAHLVGGDFLDVLTDAGGNIHAVIADVSGHGIDSALLMMSFRGTYRAHSEQHEPNALLAVLNDEICDETGDTGMFVTSAAFCIREDGRRAAYASAGHNDVFLYRARTNAVETLRSTGPSIGFFGGSDYEVHDIDLEPGDVLLLYTDGLVEATRAGSEFEMYGDERVVELLLRHSDESPAAILDALLGDLVQFTGKHTQEDDVSVLVVRVV